MKRVLNLFLAVLLVCTVNGLGDLKAQSNNKVAQLEKLSAIENNPQKTIRKQTAAIRHSLKTAAFAESVELFGCMTYSSKWSTSENGEFGIYSFPAEEGTTFTPVKTAADFNLSAAVYADGKFCGYRVTTYRVWRQLLPLRHGRLDARHTADTQSLVRQLSYQPRLR